MSEKNIVLTCIWRSDDFVVSETKIHPSENEAVLTIDENNEKISIQIPGNFSLITKKIIERRVQSISKSGFLIPKLQVRIGTGFEVEIIKDEVIPEVLLQEGHKYSLDIPTSPAENPTQPLVEKVEEEEEYVPTFLKQEQQIPDTSPTVQITSEVKTHHKAPPVEITRETEHYLDDADSIAGRFIIALAKTGDVYVTHKNNQYSVEYSAGRVDFRVHEGDIDIVLTKRITQDDQTLKQAILDATRKNE
ncbi:MAG: hypothetical protein ACFFFH_01930 [Candidatus Thorarchaeota archaeon]